MAVEQEQKKQTRTSWWALAFIALLALVAVLFLLLREDASSPPKPTPVAPSPLPPATEPGASPSADLAAAPPQEQELTKLPEVPPLPLKSVSPEPGDSLALEQTPLVTRPIEKKKEPAPDLERKSTSSNTAGQAFAPSPTPQAGTGGLEAALQAVEAFDMTNAPGALRRAVNSATAEPAVALVSEEPRAPGDAADNPAPSMDATPAFVSYFGFDKDTLSTQEREKLEAFLDRLDPQVAQLRLEGHADAVGPESYNLKLSRDRAAYVAALSAAITGFDASRIELEAWGESRPQVESSEPQALNRRVAIFVIQGQRPPLLARQQLGPLLPEAGDAGRPEKGPALAGNTASRAPAPVAPRVPPQSEIVADKSEVPRPRSMASEESGSGAPSLMRAAQPEFSGNYPDLQEQTPLLTIHFDFDSSRVSATTIRDLEQLLSRLQEERNGADGALLLTLAAHTDAVGTQAYNYGLARRRALAVAALIAESLSGPADGASEPPAVRILLLGQNFPACEPLGPPGEPRPQRCDRRVEIFSQEAAGVDRDASATPSSKASAWKKSFSSITSDNFFRGKSKSLQNTLALKGPGV